MKTEYFFMDRDAFSYRVTVHPPVMLERRMYTVTLGLK